MKTEGLKQEGKDNPRQSIWLLRHLEVLGGKLVWLQVVSWLIINRDELVEQRAGWQKATPEECKEVHDQKAPKNGANIMFVWSVKAWRETEPHWSVAGGGAEDWMEMRWRGGGEWRERELKKPQINHGNNKQEEQTHEGGKRGKYSAVVREK